MRSGPGTGYQSLGRLSSGARVTVLSQQTGTDGQTWYNIRYTSSGKEATGYVAAAYVQTAVTYTTDSDFEAYLNSQGFPESYKDGLRQLHASYPNWVFKAVNTGLDWETVIENESLPPRSLVNTSSISSWKSVEDGTYNWDTSTWTGFDGSSWVPVLVPGVQWKHSDQRGTGSDDSGNLSVRLGQLRRLCSRSIFFRQHIRPLI